MKLYTYPPAPSPQRVEIFMKEKAIEIAAEHVDMTASEQLQPAYKAINPRGTVPTLVLDDGTAISEVIAICQYLEAIYPETPLFGTTAKEKALVCEWDHRIEMECLWAIADVFRNQGDHFKGRAMPGSLDLEQIPELVDRGRLRLDAFFKILDRQLAEHEFVTGDNFTMADITAYVAMNFIGWIKVSMPDELTNLKRWFHAVAKRPSVS